MDTLDEASYGRISDESYASIAAHERNSEAPNPVIIETATTDHVEDVTRLFGKAYNMKFGLGVAATLGATLILVGTALLCALIEDAIDVELFTPLFGVITLVTFARPSRIWKAAPKISSAKRVPSCSLLASSYATLWFLFEILEWDDGR